MFKKSKIRAEEILAEDNFSEELLSQHAIDGDVDENEIRIARKIYSFLQRKNKRKIKSGHLSESFTLESCLSGGL